MEQRQKDIERNEQAQPYTHRRYAPGTPVIVAEAAQELFAEVLPCAGQQAVATTGYYWQLQDVFQGIRRQEIVPVRYQRRIYDIPERFVQLAQGSIPSQDVQEKSTVHPPSPSKPISGSEGGSSEVARVLHDIQREYEAAEQGLTGLAQGTARHQFITARMEQIHWAHEQLEDLVGPEKARILIAHTVWTPEDMGMNTR
ncbi:MAG TPA: hypothetical protein VH593_07515 [Ktedonobacteraceae bacterium]